MVERGAVTQLSHGPDTVMAPMGPHNHSSLPRSTARAMGVTAARVGVTLALLFAFLIGIRGLSVAFAGLGQGVAQAVFTSVGNPLVALLVGLLATAIVQSSSISTSMIVAFVAAPGAGLPVHSAIAMVMGANIGTTVTSSFVALGYTGRSQEFRNALEASACHSSFNLLTALVLFPLELLTGVLSKIGAGAANAIGALSGNFELPNPIGAATRACLSPLEAGLVVLLPSHEIAYAVLLGLTGALIYVCLMVMVRLLRGPTGMEFKRHAMQHLDKHPAGNLVVGTLATGVLHSSSAVTSLLVPLSAAGLLRLRHVLALTLGANLGTTLTALVASLAAPAQTANVAIQVAVVHVAFNLIGVALVFTHPALRRAFMKLPQRFARVASVSRRRAATCLLLVYYLVPTAGILLFA